MDKEECLEDRWKSKLKRHHLSCTAQASREFLLPVLCVWICPFLRRTKVTEPGYVNCCSQEPTAEPSLFTGALSKDIKQIQQPD